jgi:hypothetical protein
MQGGTVCICNSNPIVGTLNNFTQVGSSSMDNFNICIYIY